MCLGYFETKCTNGETKNQIHIERIEGVSKPDNFAEGILVVWCSKYDNKTVVVGWYKNAIVFRHYRELDTGNEYPQTYFVQSVTERCVLLPVSTRNDVEWEAPRSNKTQPYGFGQANVWFANEETAKPFINKLVGNIENYINENWLRKFPE